MSDWYNARAIFTKPYMASNDEDEEDRPILFDPGDAVFAEVLDQGDHCDVHVRDQEMPLEHYKIPKDVIEVRPAKYSLGRVQFVERFVQPTAIGSVVVPPGQVFEEAGIVDDGSARIDLLLEAGYKPIDQLRQVPRSCVMIADE